MKHERSIQLFRSLMAFFSFIFFTTALVFLFLPRYLIQSLNEIGNFFNFSSVSIDNQYFWISLTVSMMATITLCCLLLWYNPYRYQPVFWPFLTAKMTSSACGLYYFLAFSHAFCHLVIPLIDLPIALVGLWAYRSAFQEKVTS